MWTAWSPNFVPVETSLNLTRTSNLPIWTSWQHSGTRCGNLIWAGASDEYKLRKVCLSDVHHFERWQETIDVDGRPDLTDKDVATFHLSHTMVTALRKFVVTSNGYMGWTPENAQRGDSVVFFSGGKPPYVLRKVKVKINRRQELPLFEFVGDAYICCGASRSYRPRSSLL